MKTFAALAALVLAVQAAPILVRRQDTSIPDAATIARLAPDLGATPPLPPTGFGDCQGPVTGSDGQPARVPCSCPPTRDDFIRALTANVQAGFAVNNTVVKVTFPVGDSLNDKHGRITASAITLQNLVGPGKGCPLVATTLGVQSKQLDEQAANPAASSAPAPAPAASTSAAAPAVSPSAVTSAAPAATSTAATPAAPAGNGVPDAATIAQLAPDLGATPPLKPTGFGDCQGPVTGSDGQPARVPCECPPTREDFIAALTANVQAGFAVNNTVVKVTFPTGSSFNDQHARITASAITLQNLRGPGVGCPLVATTLGVQSKQLDEQEKSGASPTAANTAVAAPAAPSPAASSSVTPAASSSAPAPASPAPAASSPAAAPAPAASGIPDDATITALAPNLGASQPLKPTGFGDCEGPVNGADGKPARVPCDCPPAQDKYISQLIANVRSGFAINNPSVKVSFPTGSSAADKHGRITAAVITLQNLDGPGKGCPLVATTLGEQSKAIDAGLA